MTNKVLPIAEIAKLVEECKKGGKKIVHCHGVFDLLHPGHIKHFEAAKSFGDVLVVTVTEDQYVNRGPGRPVFNEAIRAETIAAIQDVDYVGVNYFPTAVEAIELIKPDFYVKGQDYKGQDSVFSKIGDERKAVEEHGGQLAFTQEIQFSSSNLINRYIKTENEKTKGFLNGIREKYSYESIVERFDEISRYHVVIIGDVILDEYQFVSPLGKASKSATITAKKLNSELYAGGVLAVANHIADFVKRVTLITSTGINDGIDHLDFIKERLHKKVELKSVSVDRPTTLKRRFVDPVFKHKLFEVIEIDDKPLSNETKQELKSIFNQAEQDFDLMVVADFGHGLIDKDIVQEICARDIFLAVNTQTNSANNGYNLLTKYPKCDYFSIDKEEAQLAVHDKFDEIELIHERLSKQLNVKYAAITLGVKGSAVGSNSAKLTYAPVLTNEVVDTIGAGDAFLSITSLLARQGASPEEIAFVGNAVGAMAIKILGNKTFIEKVPLLKYIKTLLD